MTLATIERTPQAPAKAAPTQLMADEGGSSVFIDISEEDLRATINVSQLPALIGEVYAVLEYVSRSQPAPELFARLPLFLLDDWSLISSDLPSWVLGFYADPLDKAPRSSSKRLVSEMARLLSQKDFAAIDKILSGIDWSRLAPEVIMGLPRTSAVAEKWLPSWKRAVQAAFTELQRRGLPAEKIMIGLVPEANVGSNPRAA